MARNARPPAKSADRDGHGGGSRLRPERLAYESPCPSVHPTPAGAAHTHAQVPEMTASVQFGRTGADTIGGIRSSTLYPTEVRAQARFTLGRRQPSLPTAARRCRAGSSRAAAPPRPLRVLAEREGFEPSKQVTPFTGLANQRLRPLGHLSETLPLSPGGGGRIRTFGGREPSAVFKTAALGRSATPPNPFSFRPLPCRKPQMASAESAHIRHRGTRIKGGNTSARRLWSQRDPLPRWSESWPMKALPTLSFELAPGRVPPGAVPRPIEPNRPAKGRWSSHACQMTGRGGRYISITMHAVPRLSALLVPASRGGQEIARADPA